MKVPSQYRILLAGEESQAICKEFREYGFQAFSCDFKDCSGGNPEWHIKGDMRFIISDNIWDMVIFFPDCTYITCSAEWAYKNPPYHQKVKPETLVGIYRIEAREKALQFICDILNLCERKDIKHYGFENPVGVIQKRIFKYYDEQTKQTSWRVFPRELNAGGLEASQYIQPYQFGEDASKKTGLWLFGLPKLTPTRYIEPRYVDGKPRWGNQTDSGQNKLSPGSNRAELRSKTYPGIAQAIAAQWGSFLLNGY